MKVEGGNNNNHGDSQVKTRLKEMWENKSTRWILIVFPLMVIVCIVNGIWYFH